MADKNGLVIVRINDCDWWIGYDLESCIDAAAKDYGEGGEDLIDMPYVLEDEQLDKTKVFCDDAGKVISFRESMNEEARQGGRFPRFFASTEY